jgi:hypothetical protein
MTEIPLQIQKLWDAIRQNREDFSRKAREILKDESLTPLAKRQKVKALHQEAVQKHDRLVRQWQAEMSVFRQSLARSALRPRSDVERTLLAQVQKASPEELQELVKTAKTTDDTSLARVVGLVAHTRGDWRTLAEVSDLLAGADDLLEVERAFGALADPQTKFGLQVELTRPSLPPEFER